MKKSQTSVTIFYVVLIIIVGGIIALIISRSSAPNPRVGLAECITEKGAVFYGAYWCPHCNNQKILFGRTALKQIKYVECALFPADASRVAKQVLEQYNAGTYTGAYLEQLELAKAGGTLDKWEPTQTEECITAKIESYPTWTFADGSRETGEIPLETLAEITACEYDN